MTARYVFVLMMLAVGGIVQYSLLQHHLQSQVQDAAIINVSGRQRMLSQRIALHAVLLLDVRKKVDQAVNRRGLIDAIALMEASSESLIHGRSSLNVGQLSSEMAAIYFASPSSLQEQVRGYLEHAKALAASPANGSAEDYKHLENIINVALGPLLDSLNKAVSQLQSESEARNAWMDTLFGLILAMNLVMLAVAGIFFLRPMVVHAVAAQDALRTLNENLEVRVKDRSEDLVRVRNQFIHNVNHELRTPVTCINASLKMLVDEFGGNIPERHKQLLDLAQRNVSHLVVMIDDLLDMSRSQTGKLNASPHSLVIRALIDEVVESMALVASAKSIGIKVEISSDMPATFADSGRLRQILVNLIGNAIKFTPEKGLISVGAGVFLPDPGFNFISVSDTGPGIRAEEAGKLFERLYQSSSGVVQGGSGLGLGLYICKELVTLQGGRIWVESVPSGGSRFVFTLPQKDAKTSEPA